MELFRAIKIWQTSTGKFRWLVNHTGLQAKDSAKIKLNLVISNSDKTQ
jgi:hypothetical protein